MSKIKYILAGILLISCLLNCEKHSYEFPDDLSFQFEPLEAKTTDILKFNVNMTESSQSPELFYRWDWNGDSIWDTEFSSMSSSSKRFFTSGDYTVNLHYTDGKGNSQIITKNLKIEQGFSSPKPNLLITPESGNFTQEFVFDASSTIDYEDSLDLLLFRWDFEGDGYWDTDFDTIKIVAKKYQKAGFFIPKLEVKDPSKRVGSVSKELIVHKTDTLIQVEVSWMPQDIAVGDTVVFDVSDSQYSSDPDAGFKTSWLMPNNPVWTEPSGEKQFEYVFRSEGKNQVGCKIIMEHSSLENTHFVEIFAAAENLPPEPFFLVSIPYGNIHTQFYFDCWASSDDNLPPSQIFLRWDWNNDGEWDTPFSQDKIYFHQFTEPGVYGITLQAMDNFQVTTKTYGQITVSPYENPTGYIIDNRDGEVYGTVQIGTQWWMAENLRYEVPWKSKSGVETSICLFEKAEWCESVGKLYHTSSVISDRFDDKEDEDGPGGWHIPTKEDLEQLIDNIGGPGQISELAFGGSADYNGLYLGYGDYFTVSQNMIIIDTIYTFHETYESMNFMSSSIAPDINNARIDVYTMTLFREDGRFWDGYSSTRHYLPIRCIKDQ